MRRCTNPTHTLRVTPFFSTLKSRKFGNEREWERDGEASTKENHVRPESLWTALGDGTLGLWTRTYCGPQLWRWGDAQLVQVGILCNGYGGWHLWPHGFILSCSLYQRRRRAHVNVELRWCFPSLRQILSWRWRAWLNIYIGVYVDVEGKTFYLMLVMTGSFAFSHNNGTGSKALLLLSPMGESKDVG